MKQVLFVIAEVLSIYENGLPSQHDFERTGRLSVHGWIPLNKSQ